jgi:hypothetical protein
VHGWVDAMRQSSFPFGSMRWTREK